MENHPCHCGLSWIIVSTWYYLKGVPGKIRITASLDKRHRLQCPRTKLRAKHSHLKGQVAAWDCSPKLPELLISFKRTQKSDFHRKHLSFLIPVFKGINFKNSSLKATASYKKSQKKPKKNLWDDYGPWFVLSQLDLFLNVHTHWNHLESLKKKIQCFIRPASRPNASESLRGSWASGLVTAPLVVETYSGVKNPWAGRSVSSQDPLLPTSFPSTWPSGLLIAGHQEDPDFRVYIWIMDCTPHFLSFRGIRYTRTDVPFTSFAMCPFWKVRIPNFLIDFPLLSKWALQGSLELLPFVLLFISEPWGFSSQTGGFVQLPLVLWICSPAPETRGAPAGPCEPLKAHLADLSASVPIPCSLYTHFPHLSMPAFWSHWDNHRKPYQKKKNCMDWKWPKDKVICKVAFISPISMNLVTDSITFADSICFLFF